jgi:hypothetical protein
MEGHRILREEQGCVSNCIFKFWGAPDSKDNAEKRDRDYEDCLTGCRICG